MAEPAHVESLTPEQAQVEIPTHRAGPITALPSDEHMNRLYRHAYPVAAAPAPASEAVATATASIVALRKEQGTVNEGSPRARAIDAELTTLYKAMYPEPPAERDPTALALDDATPPREDAEPLLTDEDREAAWRATATTPRHDGQPWNRETVARVHALMTEHLDPEVAAAYFSHALPILNGAHAEITRGLDVSPERTEALLMAEWGEEWDPKSLAADAAWAKLPKAEQATWTRTKLRYHPNVLRFLADVGERLRPGAKA